MHDPTSRVSKPIRSIPLTGARAEVDSEVVKQAISGAQDGSSEALHFLYVRYAPDVLRCIRRLVRDDYEAEDITQNVFIKLMTVLPKYEARADVPFSAWILRVARNAALDHMRSRRSTPCDELAVVDDESGHIRHERGRDLRQALEALPPEQRDVLILRHVVGLSPLEIASMLGKTESSVHGLHHRGRISLQTTLETLGAGPVVAP